MKKICILSGREHPKNERFYFKIGRTLRSWGYDITIVSRWELPPDDMGIKFKKFKRSKVPIYGKITTVTGLIKVGMAEDADIYQVHNGDSSLLAAVVIKFLKRIKGRKVKLVYDADEYWPGYQADLFPKPLKPIVRWLATQWEHLAFNYSDAVLTANPIQRGRFLVWDRGKNMEVIYSYQPKSLIPKEFPQKDRNLVVYTGKISMERDMDFVFSLPERIENIKLLVMGMPSGTKAATRLQELLDSLSPAARSRLEFPGMLPYEESVKRIERALIGIIPYLPYSENNVLAGPPLKLFQFLANGVAIVAYDLPEIRRFLLMTGAGVLVPPGDREAFAKAIQQLLDDPEKAIAMGRRGYEITKNFLNWEDASVPVLRYVYERLERSSHERR